MVHKPVPVPDELTQPFWDAVDDKRLVVQRCTACPAFNHPPVDICPECHATEFTFEPVSGKGKIYSFTITHDARQPAFSAIQPYAVAVVELDDQPGLFMLSNIPGADVNELRNGMAVEVEFEELTPGRFIPQFHLVK